jgi:hypothetical protein
MSDAVRLAKIERDARTSLVTGPDALWLVAKCRKLMAARVSLERQVCDVCDDIAGILEGLLPQPEVVETEAKGKAEEHDNA